MVSRMAQVGIAAKYCHFRWSAFHLVGIKAMMAWPTVNVHVDTGHILFHWQDRLVLALWHLSFWSGRSFSLTGRVWPYWPQFFITSRNDRTGHQPDQWARPFRHAHFLHFLHFRKWHNISICSLCFHVIPFSHFILVTFTLMHFITTGICKTRRFG